jgi:hypothetical protein
MHISLLASFNKPRAAHATHLLVASSSTAILPGLSPALAKQNSCLCPWLKKSTPISRPSSPQLAPTLNHIPQLHLPQRRLALLVRRRLPGIEVQAGRPVQEIRILQDHVQARQHLLPRQSADVHVVDEDLPVRDLDHAEGGLHEG